MAVKGSAELRTSPSDEDAVGLAPEGDVAGGVAGDVETLKPRDLVALGELAVDRVAGAGAGLGEEARHEVVGLALADELRVLGGVGVVLARPRTGSRGARRRRGWRPGGRGGRG